MQPRSGRAPATPAGGAHFIAVTGVQGGLVIALQSFNMAVLAQNPVFTNSPIAATHHAKSRSDAVAGGPAGFYRYFPPTAFQSKAHDLQPQSWLTFALQQRICGHGCAHFNRGNGASASSPSISRTPATAASRYCSGLSERNLRRCSWPSGPRPTRSVKVPPSFAPRKTGYYRPFSRARSDAAGLGALPRPRSLYKWRSRHS